MSDIPAANEGDIETDRRGLRVLSFEECLQRVRDRTVGRVGFLSDGEVSILPVNHIVDGVNIAFRSTWGSKLSLAGNAGTAAFEVDSIDEGSASGWSVLVQGVATVVDDKDESRRLDRSAPTPWIKDGARTFWIKIRPDQVTGREILGPAGGETSAP